MRQFSNSFFLDNEKTGFPLTILGIKLSEQLQIICASSARSLFATFPIIDTIAVGELTSSDVSNLGMLLSDQARHIRKLNLSENDFGTLNDLPFEHLTSLQNLTMRGCQLHPDSFFESLQQLPGLLKLDLSDSDLSMFQTLSFNHTPNLQELNLEGCKLSDQESLKALSTLKDLKVLNLCFGSMANPL